MTSAAVVGSGPNGLAAALTLASAGVDVTIIEASDTIGGGTRSGELTVPGLIHDDCSAFHPFATSSRFAREFDLEGAGLKWRWAQHELAHPLHGGRGAVLNRSVEVTAAGLGPDGADWRRTFAPLADRFGSISDDFLQPVLSMPDHPTALARFGLRAARSAVGLARRWSTDEAQALFGGVAAHAFSPLNRPFSAAIGVALTAAGHAYGWPVAEGGSSKITDAVMRRAKEQGVRVETGRTVRHRRELGDVDLVLLDVTPRAAVDILGDDLPRRVRDAYTAYKHGPGAFKVDFAVEGGVPWAYEPARSAASLHLGGTLAEIAVAEAKINRGQLPERPFVLVGQQWLADPSRSSNDVHPLYSYAHVPAGWNGSAADMVRRIEDRIEQFAPGFRDRVVGRFVRTTDELSEHNPNYVDGDIATGATSIRQVVFRPRATLSPYSTGVPGVYLCSAATPPGAGAHGMCGFLAAREALRTLR